MGVSNVCSKEVRAEDLVQNESKPKLSDKDCAALNEIKQALGSLDDLPKFDAEAYRKAAENFGQSKISGKPTTFDRFGGSQLTTKPTSYDLGGLGYTGKGVGNSGYGVDDKPHQLPKQDTSLVDCVVNRNMRMLRSLYEQQLKKTPGFKGKMVVKLVIDSSGVAKATVVSGKSEWSNKEAGEKFEQIICSTFERMQFPATSLTIASYPLEFQPG